MAHLAHAAVVDVRQALRDGRSVLVVGPARSGLTWLVNQTVNLGLEPIVRVDARVMQSVEATRTEVAKSLSLSESVNRPSDLQIALSQQDPSRRPRLVVVNDCHRATRSALSWLFEGVLEPASGIRRTAIPFVFEGAIDPDLELKAAFPTGYSSRPLVHVVEPWFPWRNLADVDELLRARWRHSFTTALIPWIADVTGGDVGFIQELLERLPNDGVIGDETLAAAERQVLLVGNRSREIRQAVEASTDVELFRVAATGTGIRGVPPATLGYGSLKQAYLAGIVEFDGVAGAYRVRGPLTAHAISIALGQDSGGVFEGRFILGRLLTFFSHVAALELDIRSLVRSCGPKELAENVSMRTGLDEYWKPIKDAIVRCCAPDAMALGEFSSRLKAILPETQSMLDNVNSRTDEEGSDDSILERLTFSQLVSLAKSARLVMGSCELLLEEVNEHRNALAHFRPEAYGRGERLLRAIAEVRVLLDRVESKAR